MRLVLNLLTRRSEARYSRAGALVIRGFICGSGLVLTLAGCAGKVEPEIRYVRVEVPVPVPCRAPDVAVPPWAATGLKSRDSLEVKVRALLAERRQRIGYERKLMASNEACR